ncbi:hypothetical protein EGM70_02585 [Enterobacteriaceae bacterium 89]|nr:hypothetical protein [Enterobacteriaceae bacterium 89]
MRIFSKLLLSGLLFSGGLSAAAVERMNLNFQELTLVPGMTENQRQLAVQSVQLPSFCSDEPCEESGKLIWQDGSEISLKGSEEYHRSVLNGLDVGIRIEAEAKRTLQQGKGGKIDVVFYQGRAPYHSGVFIKPILRYQIANGKEVIVDIEGSVKSGSCIISEGEHLRFSVQTNLNEVARLRNGKKLIHSQGVVFDCVNVKSVEMKFSSAAAKSKDTRLLFDEQTKVGVSFTYQANGTTGDILWDGSLISLPVKNDRLSMIINLFLHGGNESARPGPFSFSGVYHAVYH